MAQKSTLVLNSLDNVASALVDLTCGSTMQVEVPDRGNLQIALEQDIPLAHKFALRSIAKGESVIKLGMPIGQATQDIAPGMHVHTHNLA